MTRALKPFEYLEPRTVQEATQFLSTYGEEAKILAGGVDLLFRMRRRQIQPRYMVVIQSIPGLNHLQGDDDGVKIGALVSLRTVELSPLIQEEYPVLHDAIHQIASTQVKNTGTAVGNLCIGTPASDVAPPLFILGAKLKVTGPAGEKIVPIDEFYTGVNTTVLQPWEMVTEIIIPHASAEIGGAFLKLVRTAADIAKVNAAVYLTILDNVCSDAKIALGSVAPTVLRARKAEQALSGKELKAKTLDEVAQVAAQESIPITDIRSTKEYRQEMVKVLVKRAIEKAWGKAKA